MWIRQSYLLKNIFAEKAWRAQNILSDHWERKKKEKKTIIVRKKEKMLNCVQVRAETAEKSATEKTEKIEFINKHFKEHSLCKHYVNIM